MGTCIDIKNLRTRAEHLSHNYEQEVVFSDLDDTISSNSTLFLSKLAFFLRMKKFSKTIAFMRVMEDFELNNNFLILMRKLNRTKIVILSRNDQDFIDYFIKHSMDYFTQYGLEIIGGIGSIDLFVGGEKLSSADKLDILPTGSILISDIFEFRTLSRYRLFYSVDAWSKFRLVFLYVYKSVILTIFLLKNIWKK